MGIDLARWEEEGLLTISQVDAAELSPGEFSHAVRQSVDDTGVQVVVIDSLNGYQAAMPQERSLLLHLHELLQFLNRRGVTTFLTVAQHGLVGDMETPVDVTYLADTVILMRYFEAQGHVRRALSVVKKRTGEHEDTIREFWISSKGMSVGPVLQNFQGVLRGVPTLVDSPPAAPKD
jgi:circadian clock protein KaiC